ncbi:MAG: glycosyltransferase family 39 protein [Patescibacteria group bacterium]|nr:glycosyltransferase family 39 protein [Patescibacteria group bacterium]
MTKKIPRPAYFLIAILIIASFFRLYNLSGQNATPPGLYPDEAMNGNNAIEAMQTGNFKVFYPENNGREGLFMDIQAPFIAIFGNTPFSLRLPSAIFGILTVLGIYFFAAELFANQTIGLLASFFTAISFWHINFSRIGFRAISAPFFLVWGLYFLLLCFRKSFKEKTPLKEHHTAWLLAALSGIVYGLGFYTYIAYRATPLLVLVVFAIWYFLNRENKKKILEVLGVFTLFTFIVAAPLGIYFLHNSQDFLGRTSQISIFSAASPIKELGINILKTLGMFNFSGDRNWRQNFAGQPEIYWPVGIMFVFGILYGIRQIIRKHGKEFIILFVWCIAAAAPVVVSDEGIPHALRSILLIPPAFIFAGVGTYKLFEILRHHMSKFYRRHDELIKNTFLLLCAALIVQTYSYYFIEWGQNPNVSGAFTQSYVDMGNMINSLPKDRIKYVVVKAGGVPVRGIPMPAQTVMYITNTFTLKNQLEKNIHYLLPGQEKDIFENDALFFYLK